MPSKNFSKIVLSSYFFATTVIFLLGFHLTALALHWYWIYRFALIDVIPHFLGGLTVANFFYLFFLDSSSPRISAPSFLIRGLLILLFVLGVGIFWEFFEFLVDRSLVPLPSYRNQFGLNDTMKDLAVDAWGGLVFIGLYFLALRWRK